MAHRQRSELVVFLQALGGVGKSFFANILSRIFGSAFSKVNEQVISGETQFNKDLVGACGVKIEETSGTSNYLLLMRGIKDLSTEPELNARYMFSECVKLRNIINIWVLSNHIRDLDLRDRRMFVPPINNKYQQNVEYFAELEACLTESALQYVFNYFYEVDISKKLLAPETASKTEYKIANLNSCVKFMINEYMVKSPSENRELKLSDAYKKYVSWCGHNNVKSVAKSDYFSNTARQYVPAVEVNGKVKQKDHTNIYDFSTKTLYDRIIVRSKEITAVQYQEMVNEFANGEQEPLLEQDDHYREMANQIVALQELLKKKDQELLRVTEELEKSKKEEEKPDEKPKEKPEEKPEEKPKVKVIKSKKALNDLKTQIQFD
jgi:hypothetical protein